MKFSILVAHFNNWEYFQETYQSILNQSYKNYEIIIVDDCSSQTNDFENLKKLAEEDAKIKLFQNKTNKGVGYTKARLAELATGDIIGFVDPDDNLYDNAIEISVEQHLKNPKLVATYSQIMLCDDKMKPQSIYPRSREIKNGNKYFFNINNEVSHFFTFRKEAYLQTEGINENLSSSVDFDLYLKLYEKGNFHYIKQPLYLYRQHPKGISQDKTKKDRIYKNWNKVLYDTCQRRKITKLYGNKLTEDLDLARIIFQNQNRFIDKLKRFISSKL